MDFLLDGLRALFALGLTLGLLLGAAWLARRYGLMQGGTGMKPGAPRRLELIEQLWLDGGKSRLMIVRCDAQEHVLLVTPQGAHPVTGIQRPEAAP